MVKAAKIAGMLVGITGAFQVVVGLLMWTGRALSLTSLHMLVGIIFVLLLWVVAAMAIRARVPAGLIVLAFVWGAVVILLGMTQTKLLTGPNHWIVRAVHLLVGIGAMAQAGGLTRRIRENGSRVAAPAQPLAPAR